MPLHAELLADRRKRALQFLQSPACRDREVHPHEETLILRIAELRAVDDVAFVRQQQVRDRSDDADAIRTGQRKYQAAPFGAFPGRR